MTSKAIKARKSRLNSRVIRENDRRKKRELFLFFMICILLSMPVLLYLMNRMEYVRYEYEMKELKERKQSLQKEKRYLEVEKATLEAPHVIEKKAIRNLNLIKQEEGGSIVIVQFKEPSHKEVLIAEKLYETTGEQKRKAFTIH